MCLAIGLLLDPVGGAARAVPQTPSRYKGEGKKELAIGRGRKGREVKDVDG